MTKLNPIDVAYVEHDREIGGRFAYREKDVAISHTIEPVGVIISAATYNELVGIYGIPTIDAYINAGRRKNVSKIIEIMESRGLLEEREETEQQPEEIPEERSLEEKRCSCGKIILRSDYENLSDHNWLSKKHCSKACANRSRRKGNVSIQK